MTLDYDDSGDYAPRGWCSFCDKQHCICGAQAEIDREERDTIPAPSPELDGPVRLMNMALWFAQGGRF